MKRAIVSVSMGAVAVISSCVVAISQAEPRFVLIQNPNDYEALYLDGHKIAEGHNLHLFVGRDLSEVLVETQSKPSPSPSPLPTPKPNKCGDLPCPSPTPTPKPDCVGPFCPGGMPFYGKDPRLIIWRNENLGNFREKFSPQEMPIRMQRLIETQK